MKQWKKIKNFLLYDDLGGPILYYGVGIGIMLIMIFGFGVEFKGSLECDYGLTGVSC